MQKIRIYMSFPREKLQTNNQAHRGCFISPSLCGEYFYQMFLGSRWLKMFCVWRMKYFKTGEVLPFLFICLFFWIWFYFLFYFVGGGEVPHHMPSFGQGIPFEESHLNVRCFTVTIVTWEELNNNHELSIEYFDLQKYILKYFFRLWLLLVSQTLYLHC